MRLAHFSNEVVTLKRDWLYGNIPQGYLKPSGFWVSDEDDFGWQEWCRENEFRLDRLRYEHAVTLAPGADILHLKTARAVKDFHLKYATPYLDGLPEYLAIDWPQVYANHQGILITPYQWKLRLDFDLMWCGGWDCASGCIWDLNAIASLDVLPSGRTRGLGR